MLRSTHRDRGADAVFALQIQGAPVLFDEGLGQRQAETGAFIFVVEVAVDLLEGMGIDIVASRRTLD